MGTKSWHICNGFLIRGGGGGLDDHDFFTIWPTPGFHGRMVKNF